MRFYPSDLEETRVLLAFVLCGFFYCKKQVLIFCPCVLLKQEQQAVDFMLISRPQRSSNSPGQPQTNSFDIAAHYACHCRQELCNNFMT